jgi:ribosomal peptide maturation radical SAM protein 1
MPSVPHPPADVESSSIGGIRPSDGSGLSAESDRPETEDAEPIYRDFRIAEVALPFGESLRPSHGFAIMKALFEQAGIPADEHFLHFDLAAQLGFQQYEIIRGDLLCPDSLSDWLFTRAAFGEEAGEGDCRAMFPGAMPRIADVAGKDVAFLNDLRERILPAYVDDCVDRIDWGVYGYVVFITGREYVAPLAFARRIKAKFPHVATVIVGATVDAEMAVEYVRAFPFLDYMIVGEADRTLVTLARRLAEGGSASDLPGIAMRCGDGVSCLGPAPPVDNLDTIPAPNYDAYFEVARRYGYDKYADAISDPLIRFFQTALEIESAKGCWWGVKSKCSFCHHPTLTYRSKSPERLLSVIDELAEKYDTKSFICTDPILNMRYIDELFGPLAAREEPYRFFFFMKANMTRDQIRTMARGGLRCALPGIESVNTHLLKLMRKGVTKLQNVNLLRWLAYYNIGTFWFVLTGFPGEQPEDYADQLDTLRLITHTPPPTAANRLWLERSSPNFVDKQLFPTKFQVPAPDYGHLYPGTVNLDRIAYFFDYEAEGVLPEETHRELKSLVARWRHEWNGGNRPTLTYRRAGSDILIDDTRNGRESCRSYTLSDRDADLYEAFSSAPRTPAQVCAALASEGSGREIAEECVRSICDDLCDGGLMIGEAGKYLSLAIPADPEC